MSQLEVVWNGAHQDCDADLLVSDRIPEKLRQAPPIVVTPWTRLPRQRQKNGRRKTVAEMRAQLQARFA